MTIRRRQAFQIAALCCGFAAPALAAPPAARPLAAPAGTGAAVHAIEPEQRLAPQPHLVAPYKPLDLSNPGVGLQQSTVEWTVPDQSGGRLIAQWQVSACPYVNGSPYAACLPVATLSAGQPSGGKVQAQIPAKVSYLGSPTPVNGAQICASNAAGSSCADRITVRFVNAGSAPARIQASSGIGQGLQGAAGAPGSGAMRGIIVVTKPPAGPGIFQALSVETARIAADGTGASLLSGRLAGLVQAPALVADGTGASLLGMQLGGLIRTATITADGNGAALVSSVIPGLVRTKTIAADGIGVLGKFAPERSIRVR